MKTAAKRFSLAVVAGLVGLVLPGPARAVDGVIEISQAKALAGGVNGSLVSDPPGFPVQISVAGSYRLTSNLVVSALNTAAIRTSVDDVTIDLNGFEVTGPVACLSEGPGLTCSPASSEPGIGGSATARMVVKNGTVTGFGAGGVEIPAGGRVEALIVRGNGGIGIFMGASCTVKDSVAFRNTVTGIDVRNCIVSHNQTNQNRQVGILAESGSTISNNTSWRNGSAGISCSDSSVTENAVFMNFGSGITANNSKVTGNVAAVNGVQILAVSSLVMGNRVRGCPGCGFGLDLFGSGYTLNVISTDGGAGAVSGGTNLGANLCDGALCP